MLSRAPMSSSMERQKEIKQEFEVNPVYISPESMEPDPLSTFTSLLEDNTTSNSITNWLAESLQTHHESFTSLLSGDPFGLPFDLGIDPLWFNAESLGFPDPNSVAQFQSTHLAESSYEALGAPRFVNPSEIFEPVEVDTEIGVHPTFFEKKEVEKGDGFEEEENGSFDGSVLNCVVDENVKDLEQGKGKKKRKKGEPAKNLMAERRRRKRLNDRLCMLRSVVPRISKVRAFYDFAVDLSM